jgi:hypothetical protein
MGRPGTFRLARVRNRLDYILISQSLVAAFNGGGIFRKGVGHPNHPPYSLGDVSGARCAQNPPFG